MIFEYCFYFELVSSDNDHVLLVLIVHAVYSYTVYKSLNIHLTGAFSTSSIAFFSFN